MDTLGNVVIDSLGNALGGHGATPSMLFTVIGLDFHKLDHMI